MLSLVTAVVVVAIKLVAYALTGSVGLLSDAVESVINVVAAGVAVWALTLAARPPDEEHAYGHSKAEYFSSGVEATLILVAAVAIAIAAWGRFWHPQPLGDVWLGLGVSLVATALNGAVAVTLWRAGRRLRSITLRADAKHLLTDVWTSAGVLAGVLLVPLTGWLRLDPLIAFVVAINIVWTGLRLLHETGSGLLDAALPSEDRAVVDDVLASYAAQGVLFHAVRTRVAGQRRFVSLHVLVPGDWAVARGHVLCERIAADIVARLPQTTVFTHLEPRDDPASFADQGLDSRPVEAGDREAARSSRRHTVRALGDRTGIGQGTP